MNNSRLRILYEDDPVVLSLIEWIEKEDERNSGIRDRLTVLESDWERAIRERNQAINDARQARADRDHAEERLRDLERTVSALKDQISRSNPRLWTTTYANFHTTTTGSPRWEWRWMPDGTYEVKEVRPPDRGTSTGGR